MNNDLPAKNLDELLTNNGIKFPIHLAQDFVNEIFHYGIMIKGETFIINSKKEMLSVPDLISKGYIPLTEVIEKSNFTKRGIINFMRTEKQANAYKLFTSLSNYINRFIIFKNSGYSELIALWIMGTYIYMVFQYYPYLHITAEKASGKSLLLDIISPVAFNGEISCNATPAVIYRDILINQPTMLIDEVENLNKYNPQGAGAIMDVLKSGFQKTGTVKRCVGDKFIPQSFPTYSAKILTGINPLEEVLSDRTIKIQMVRKLDHEFVERYILTQELIEYQRTLRNVLYIFGLTHSNKIFDLIKSFDYYNAEFDH